MLTATHLSRSRMKGTKIKPKRAAWHPLGDYFSFKIFVTLLLI